MKNIIKKNIIKVGGILEDYGGKELKDVAKTHNVKVEHGYYEWILTGKLDDIEDVTVELWNMPRDQWEENGLSII